MARTRNTESNTLGDSAGTVTVACRLPAGLRIEGIPRNLAESGVVMFKGSNDKRAIQMADEYGFHGLTSGIPADVWTYIEEKYAKAKWLTSGALFATGKAKDAMREAQDIGDKNVGFNGLDPDNLPARIEDALKAEKKP